ncbi:MAG: hypothetical protein JXQ90_21265 [Cyclobacteriaceae bacterium]
MRRLIFIFIFLGTTYTVSADAKQGVMDLSLYNFNEPIELNGEWEFYWSKLLTPNQSFYNKKFLEFPGLWNGQVVGKDTTKPIGYATYKLRVILPDQPTHYSMFIDDMYCAYQLFINGRPVAANGIVSHTREQYTPEWRPQVIDIHELTGTLELTLHIANFDHSKGGANRSILLGTSQGISSFFNTNKVLDISLTALFMAMAIFFFIRFGFITLDLSSLFFSLFCITYSYRILGSDMYFLLEYLPGIPWEAVISIEYISLYISPLFLGIHLQEMYPAESNKKILRVLYILCVAFTLCVPIFPVAIYSRLNLYFFMMCAVFMFYGFTIYISAFINKQPGSIYGILSGVIAFTVFAFLALEYSLILERQKLMTYIFQIVFLGIHSIQLIVNTNARMHQDLAS